MAAWPGSLPQAPLLDEFEYVPFDPCVVTEMDTGPPQRRRRFSTAFGRYSIVFVLTGRQVAAFVTFYFTTLAGAPGTITGFPDPRDGATATFQFAPGSVPSRAPITSGATAAERAWHVSMQWDRVA